jgi:hypothetical protein
MMSNELDAELHELTVDKALISRMLSPTLESSRLRPIILVNDEFARAVEERASA